MRIDLSALAQDVRLAASQLRRRPAFTIGASCSLAIGMALATALFSIVQSVMLRPLPFDDPTRLVSVIETVDHRDGAQVQPRMLHALHTASTALSDVAAFARTRVLAGSNGEARSVDALRVTTNFFDLLRLHAVRGRAFDATDAVGASRTVLISHAYWVANFGADDRVIGKQLRLDRASYTIIGVLPASLDEIFGARIWLPLPRAAFDDEVDYGPGAPARWYQIVARLAPGATVAQANAEAAFLYDRTYHGEAESRLHSARAVALDEYVHQGARNALSLWSMAATLILILCAVNFATMSLARSMRRREDIAVRAALGASRFRLVRMLIVESALLASLGGAAAVLMARWILSFVSALVADGPLGVTLTFDWATIAFGFGLTLVIGIAFAMAPALELARVDLRAIIQGGASSTTARGGELRGRRALVALQFCLALAAVSSVTALVKADRRFQRDDLGFDYTPIVLADLSPSDSGARQIPIQPLVDFLRDKAGVRGVAAMGGTHTVALLGGNDDDAVGAGITDVSPTFFNTLGVRPIAGRLPSDDEIRSGSDVVVAGRAAAIRAFGSAQAGVNKNLRIKAPGKPPQILTVVGVVDDLGGDGLYFGWSLYTVRDLFSEPRGTLIVRAAAEPERLVKELTRALVTFDSRFLVSDARTAASVVDAVKGSTRGRALFLTGVAILSLLLAIVGVYGLTAYTTELRAREIGIRIALGAASGRIAQVVMSDLWWMAGLGIVSGLLTGSLLVDYLDSLYRNPMMHSRLVVFPVGPTAASAAALLLIMVAGTAVPLRRVMKLDVMRTIQGGGG